MHIDVVERLKFFDPNALQRLAADLDLALDGAVLLLDCKRRRHRGLDVHFAFSAVRELDRDRVQHRGVAVIARNGKARQRADDRAVVFRFDFRLALGLYDHLRVGAGFRDGADEFVEPLLHLLGIDGGCAC